MERGKGGSGRRCAGGRIGQEGELVEGRRAERDVPQGGVNPDRHQPQARHPQHPIHPRRQGAHRQHQGLHPHQGKTRRSRKSCRASELQIGKAGALGVQIGAALTASRQSKGSRGQRAALQGQTIRQLRGDHGGGGAGIQQQADSGSLAGSSSGGAGCRPGAGNLKIQHRGVASLGPLKRQAHRAPAAAARKGLAGELDQGMGANAWGGPGQWRFRGPGGKDQQQGQQGWALAEPKRTQARANIHRAQPWALS